MCGDYHMKFRRYAIAACVAGSFLALGACNSDKKAGAASDGSMAVKADNTMCPVGGGPVAAAVTPSTYKGKHVGFCCAGCKGKFDKMSDAEKDAKVTTMK